MLTVIYCPYTGPVFPDKIIEIKVRETIEEYNRGQENLRVYTGSELMLRTYQVAVKDNKIEHKKIRFQFVDRYIYLDKRGTCSSYEDNFMSFVNTLLFKLI